MTIYSNAELSPKPRRHNSTKINICIIKYESDFLIMSDSHGGHTTDNSLVY